MRAVHMQRIAPNSCTRDLSYLLDLAQQPRDVWIHGGAEREAARGGELLHVRENQLRGLVEHQYSPLPKCRALGEVRGYLQGDLRGWCALHRTA